AVGAEEPAPPGTRPDDRLVHDRTGLDLLVGPDADVGVDRGGGADGDVAADDAPLLEKAAVLDRHRPAHDRAAQPPLAPALAAVPDDRVRELHARVDGRVRAEDRRTVHPSSAPHLGAGADEDRSVDTRA